MRINKRNLLLILFDVVCFALLNIAYYFLAAVAYYSVIHTDPVTYIINVAVLFVFIFVARFLCGVYSTVWRYTSTQSYFRLILADMFGGIVTLIVTRIADIYLGIWVYLTVASLGALVALSARYSYRLLYKRHHLKTNDARARTKIGIVGAGQLGVFLADELRSNPNSQYLPVCFIDNDEFKAGNKIAGLRVHSPEQFAKLVNDYEISEVVIAIAKVDSEQISRFYDFYNKIGCKVKIYDSPLQSGSIGVGDRKKRIIREFQIEDLLFRQPLSINDTAAFNYYKGKTVLVTGGGGSIGSELCRQIAKCLPARLIIFDIYENNAYDIQQELIREYGDNLNLCVEIGSVRDRKRLEYIFDLYRPNIVFHAAAHKHVPLMEHSGSEAIKNNVLGTYNTADMSEKYGVEKFILISTDKAVNPTNIMGASKRLCEMVVQCRTDSATSFAAVRFGNVLGSNGSVIPLFKKQIASGGPVTITDKRIIRYFMTIPEASQLVMQAGAMAKKGELFVLDMGKPVRIYDLAENMIKLSGFVPNVDIKIEEVGLRPGEKLYEELLMKTEELDKTENNMIFIEKDTPLSRDEVEGKLSALKKAVEEFEQQGKIDAVKQTIKQVVPTFHTPEEINEKATKSEEMKIAGVK